MVIGRSPATPLGARADYECIVVDLPLRPGHSGGPLLDAGGRLIGITTMVAGPGVGFAIPAEAVKAFLRHALASESAAA